jgi:hypothetical protein
MKSKSSTTEITSKLNQPQPTDYTAAGETAFATTEPMLVAMPRDSLLLVNIDVQIAAITALAVARSIDADAGLRARFEGLAKIKEFDLAKLNGLATVALATWFARHMYLLASATRTEAQLPASVVEVASSLKNRMMRVVDYHLGDHAVAGPIVTAIRAGTGYLDLANDLVALARLYKKYLPLLEHDKKDYQAADETLAAQTGDQIINLLGGSTPEQRKWADLQARAWSRLSADYDEVSAAGRYLKRNDDDLETAFPSLIAASRTAASKAPTTEQPADPPAPEGQNDKTG